MPLAKRLKSERLFLLLLLAALVLGGCSPHDQAENAIRLGYTPSDRALTDRAEAYTALRDYLSQRIGRTIKLVKTSSYEPAISAMREGEIDIMNFGSQAYLIAETQAGAEAFALRGEKDGTPKAYHSYIIAPADSPYETIEDAVLESKSLKTLYTNSASTSGYLVVKTFFKSIGIDPEESFASAQFTNSHVLSILKTSHGEADLACVNSVALARLVDEGKIDSDSVRVLWKSDPIPNGPVAYRSSLPEPLKLQIREAYYELSEADPESWKQVAELYPDEDFIYIPFRSEVFDKLRELNAKLD